jgi:hypothetical protein
MKENPALNFCIIGVYGESGLCAFDAIFRLLTKACATHANQMINNKLQIRLANLQVVNIPHTYGRSSK